MCQMQTYHLLLVIFSCLKVHSISGSQHTDYCLSLRDADTGTAADHTDREDRCIGKSVPNGRESCSRCLGTVFPTGWEQKSRPNGNSIPDRSGIRHNAGRHDGDFAVSVGKQATAG